MLEARLKEAESFRVSIDEVCVRHVYDVGMSIYPYTGGIELFFKKKKLYEWNGEINEKYEYLQMK